MLRGWAAAKMLNGWTAGKMLRGWAAAKMLGRIAFLFSIEQTKNSSTQTKSSLQY
jgi:hypothetical protein